MSRDEFMKTQYRDLPELEDDMLIADYCKSASVCKRMCAIKCALLSAGLSASKSHSVSKKLLPWIVPAGTKSKIRGDRFNEIVAREVRRWAKRIPGCVFKREHKHRCFDEIPDWIVERDGKTLAGFNQISLFGGGHQVNRGNKYVLDDAFHDRLSPENVRMICVVKDVPRASGGRSSKAVKILERGLEKRRIYGVAGVRRLLDEYFVR